MLVRTKLSIAVVLLACLAGCGKKESDKRSGDNSEVTASASGALVEAFDHGTVAWRVKTDGSIFAEVRDEDGQLRKDATGKVEWTTEEGEIRTAKLAWDDEAHALTGKGPEPTRDVTELRWSIEGKEPAQGTLHVPSGGTAAIHADAEAAASVKVSGEPPHGGVVQVVGEDRLEIVADDDSDEVRVYVLDASLKPVSVGVRVVTIAVVADVPQVVVLTPSADGLYLVGKWKIKTDPTRITVVVKHKGKAHVAIVGWKPGVKLVGKGGPKVKVKVKGLAVSKVDVKVKDKDDDVDVKVKGGGKDKVDIKIKDGPGAPTMVKVNGGKVKVKVK